MGLNGKIKKAISYKLDRLRSWEKPRIIDLFAGCGGISLGAHLAGSSILGAVEIDPLAARSHALNFHGSDDELFEWHAKAHVTEYT